MVAYYTSLSIAYFLLLTSVSSQEFEPRTYCVPADSCWPSIEQFDTLQADNPSLKVILRGDAGWEQAGDLVLNRRVTESPGATVYVSTVEDIIQVVNFTQQHNINLKIISSGHEFIGRNIREGCLLMSVANMVSTSIDLNCTEHYAGCYTVEPGVWWLQAYREADGAGRIVLGGAEPSVSVTGWALGGGHSPYSPKLGLGADQIIEITMVLADLSVVTLNKDGMSQLHSDGTTTNSDSTDLFWAVRGGGGGTFGVVTSIKYRLHMPPSKFTTFTCEFSAIDKPKAAMKEIKKKMRGILVDLPEEFGGYLITGALCYQTIPHCESAVFANYYIMHYGSREENSDKFELLEQAASELKSYQLSENYCGVKEYDTYFDYVLTLPNVTYADVDIDGTFLTSTEYDDTFIDKEAGIYASVFNSGNYFSSTWIKLGGQTKNDSSGATAVNPTFRNAMWTIAYGGTPSAVKKFDKLVAKTVATPAQYFSECDDDLPPGEWQRQFWGETTQDYLILKESMIPIMISHASSV